MGAAEYGVMHRKALLFAILLAGLIGGVAFAFDALTTTEEERIDEFVEVLTGEIDQNRIDTALRYTDPSREPVEVAVNGDSQYYEEGDEVTLAENAHAYLEPLFGQNVDLLQENIEISDRNAAVHLRVLSNEGPVDLEIKLRRHNDGWLIHQLRVRA